MYIRTASAVRHIRYSRVQNDLVWYIVLTGSRYAWSSRSGAATLSPRYKGWRPNDNQDQFISESICVGFIWGISVLLIWLVILEKLQNA